MADPIGISAGLLALITFACTSTVSLYETIESFQTHPRKVRELKEELDALTSVLQSLQATVAANDVDLDGLRVPLFKCGNVCKGFETLIIDLTSHSGGSRTSFRDWAKLRYKGSSITEFKNTIETYKSVIAMVMMNANLTTTNADIVKKYQATVANTISSLEERLHEIDDKLQGLSEQGKGASSEVQEEQEERQVAQQGIFICQQASEFLSQLRVNVFEEIAAAQDARQAIVSTFGDLISAKRVSAGVGTTQILGHISDTSLQNLLGKGEDKDSKSLITA